MNKNYINELTTFAILHKPLHLTLSLAFTVAPCGITKPSTLYEEEIELFRICSQMRRELRIVAALSHAVRLKQIASNDAFLRRLPAITSRGPTNACLHASLESILYEQGW